jgi:2,5-diamino-6-(ribosylamino)-4(3H)-pyrimidinone 5'-phosphate reductase
MLPRVVYHVEASLDGSIDWITPDVGRYYRLASVFSEDCALTGADTVITGPGAPIDDEPEPPSRDLPRPSGKPLLAVTDSRGRVHTWNWLRGQTDYFRDVVALCSRATPWAQLDELRRKGVASFAGGEDRVDLPAALEWLRDEHGVERVRVDSGGALAGALLRAGLVDEVSVIVEPVLVGGTCSRGFFRAPDLTGPDGVVRLRLTALERFDDDALWLRYDVVG